MPEVIYKVFISSTYDDLREERSELQKALLKLKCLPVGMELFPSADEETWQFIEKQIEDSDYYVVIIAGRYGSETDEGISFTEKEYDFARKIGKRVIAFVHGNMKNIPVGRTDIDELKREKLRKFIDKVRKSPVNEFASPHELASHATISFVDMRERYPAVGFIRADQSVDQKRHIELLEENARLKERLANMESEKLAPFPNFEDQIEIEFEKHDSKTKMITGGITTATWKEIFLIAARNVILGGSNERWMPHTILCVIWDKTDDFSYYSCENFRERLTTLFVAFGLFEVEDRPGQGGFERHFVLTDYGRRQFALLGGV